MADGFAAHNRSFLEEHRVADDLQNCKASVRLQGSKRDYSWESPQQGDMATPFQIMKTDLFEGKIETDGHSGKASDTCVFHF